MNRNTVFTIIGIVVLITLLAGYKGCSIYTAIQQNANFAPPPEAITSAVAKEETWTNKLSAVGSLMAMQGVTISAEEAGKVTKIGFESGSAVNQGDLLVEIDTSVEEAKLKGALAWEARTQKALTRSQQLRTNNAVSADELDNASGEYQRAASEVESLKATIAKKRITAPFAGKTGIRMVNVGEYLSQGTPIVPLHSLGTLYTNFSLPQQALAKLKVGQSVSLAVDAFPNENFEGKINAINPNVSDSNRNVEVQATIKNDDERLRPGMFVTAHVSLAEETKVIALPVTSINYAPYGDSVYIIEKVKDPKDPTKEFDGVRQQFVKIGSKQGDQVAILSGIKPGEQVATSGLFKLRPGASVAINNAHAPSDSKSPSPADT